MQTAGYTRMQQCAGVRHARGCGTPQTLKKLPTGDNTGGSLKLYAN
jgi:hypothetical protein